MHSDSSELMEDKADLRQTPVVALVKSLNKNLNIVSNELAYLRGDIL